MKDLVFDPVEHKYFYKGKPVPGVSTVLKKVGLSKNYDNVDPFYRDRGVATHLAIKFYLKGTLDPESLDEEIKKPFNAFLGFWKKHDHEEILYLEDPMVDVRGVYAGTPDLITRSSIYDWKISKAHDRVADLQGQLYKKLLMDSESISLPFKVVELHPDGTHEEFDYGSGVENVEHILGLYKWKTK